MKFSSAKAALPYFPSAATGSQGSSNAALTLDRTLGQALAERNSAPGRESRMQALWELLAEIASECSAPNWNGEGASAVGVYAFDEASRVLDLLPERLLPQDVYPEPRGAIAFHWMPGDGKHIVISVSGNRSIEFAAVRGPLDEEAGRKPFSTLLPPAVMVHLTSRG